MIHSKKLTIPINTPLSRPVSIEVIIREKFITRIEVMLDIVASQGMVGIRIAGGEPGKGVFVFPSDAEDWFWKSDVWVGKIEVPEYCVRFPIKVYGISPRTIYPHTAIVIIHTSSI
ncbi:MAG: hypothetical protein DDT40_01366 [candidate division WS2 bacterium]|nr:hypothetical protein [Candidatus Psychracetigena formicireducens]